MEGHYFEDLPEDFSPLGPYMHGYGDSDEWDFEERESDEGGLTSRLTLYLIKKHK